MRDSQFPLQKTIFLQNKDPAPGLRGRPLPHRLLHGHGPQRRHQEEVRVHRQLCPRDRGVAPGHALRHILPEGQQVRHLNF